jgi:hypothetical protein
MANQLARIEGNSPIELESLARVIRCMPTVNAPLPEGDEAARATARDRFDAFIERLGQQGAIGRLRLVPEHKR